MKETDKKSFEEKDDDRNFCIDKIISSNILSMGVSLIDPKRSSELKKKKTTTN